MCVVCSGFSETQLLPQGLQFASQLVLTAAPAVLGGTECSSIVPRQAYPTLLAKPAESYG